MRPLLPLLVLSLLSTSGCGPTRPSRPGGDPVTTLEVDNQNFSDMTVYLVNGGQRVRLGRATGKTRTTMTLPRGVLTFPRELQFQADPMGGRAGSVTNRLWVTPGDRVVLILR